MRVGRGMLLVVVVSGCGSGVNEETTVYRGTALFGHEVRSFQPCSSAASLWTVDSSGLLWDVHGELAPQGEPYQGLFAVVEGRLDNAPGNGLGADYVGTLVVDDVLYVAREGYGCGSDWEAFRYRAFGNEPFWSVDISATNIALRALGQDDQTWTLTHESATESTIQLDGEGIGGESITVEIRRRGCRDTMAGSFFGLTATVRYGKSILTGCALAGARQ